MEILAVVEEEGDTWMTPILEYLMEETLPVDVKKARAVRRKSRRFAVINGILYKKSFLRPWLRVLLVPSFETAGRGPETDYLSPSYALLNKGIFFTRSWASRNKMALSSILGPASNP
ncbi:hypothetical protein Tco_0107366 [Tanacetum coccineum]